MQVRVLVKKHAEAESGLAEAKRGRQVKKHEVEGAVGCDKKQRGPRWDVPCQW